MSEHVFDEDKAWENITARIRSDEAKKQWTLFGVACINPDRTSHGVTIAPNAADAFEASKEANKMPAPDAGCVYYPVGITIMPEVLILIMEQLANEPPEGRLGT